MFKNFPKKILATESKYSLKRRNILTAYAMLLPTFILITVFAIIPILITLTMSFTDLGFYKGIEFVGFENFRRVLRDDLFINSIFVGFKLVLLVVPIQLVLSFIFAHIIKDMPPKLAGFVKTSIFIPIVISGIIASIIFVYIYDYQGGLLNFIVDKLGFETQAWLVSKKYALICVALPSIWMWFGYSTLLMLAGLLDIPKSYYDAAVLDGANAIQKIYYITIPLMKNITIFLLISRFIYVIQEFDLAYQMTRGDPLHRTLTPVLHLYNHFGKDITMGYTLAGALLVAVLIGSVSGVLFKVINKKKGIHT